LKLTPSPVKAAALNEGIEVLQPTDLCDEDFVHKLRAKEIDLFVVIAYGRLLPSLVLGLPKKFCLNMHASLLPKYRGAAPINWAIINGEEATGVSAIRMTKTMDAGDVIFQEKIKIDAEDTAVSLRAKLADLSTLLLLRTLEAVETDNHPLQKQDDNKVTLAPKLTKETGLIKWDKSAREIHNLARGLLPWPCAYTRFDGKVLKILETDVLQGQGEDRKPGEVIAGSREGIAVATGKDVLLVRTVRPQDSKSMTAAGFLAGHPLPNGFRLK
jgi:methionyl-tRNA formyltransferase